MYLMEKILLRLQRGLVNNIKYHKRCGGKFKILLGKLLNNVLIFEWRIIRFMQKIDFFVNFNIFIILNNQRICK